MPGMTIVDVGANIGYYTVLCSHAVGRQGRVHAFEPDAEAYRYLEMNVERMAAGNVTPVQAAVADRTGSRAFVSNELERGFLSIATDSVLTRTVTTVALDDYFRRTRLACSGCHQARRRRRGEISAGRHGRAKCEKQKFAAGNGIQPRCHG